MDFADWAEFRAQKRLDNLPKETVNTICGMLEEIDAIKNDWHAPPCVYRRVSSAT
jgi:hypothetical protein